MGGVEWYNGWRFKKSRMAETGKKGKVAEQKKQQQVTNK